MEIVISHIRKLLMMICDKNDWCDECPLNKHCFAISGDKTPKEMDDAQIKTLITLMGEEN